MLSEDQILIKSIQSQLETLEKKYIKELSPKKQHFNEGDIAYICRDRFDVREVVITEILDFSEGGKNPGGYLYYWYNYKDIPKFNYFLYKIYSKFFWNILYPLARRKLYKYSPDIPEYLGPGHAVLAGKGEYLFKTHYEAMLSYHFDWCNSELNDIECLITDRE